MIRVLTVFGMDPSYEERFVNYVDQKERIPLTAMSFSGVEKFRQYSEEHVIETLLTDEDARELVRDVEAKQTMVSCQGELVEGKEEFPVIYKYQSGGCAMREVTARYYSQPMEPALALLGSRAVVIEIYSPMNQYLKSSLTLTMCQQVAWQEAVLYMNLKEYSGSSGLVCDDYRADLSDVLYLYRQGTYNWMRLKFMAYNWGNMDYIPPVRYGEDLSQVTPEEVAMPIDRIVRESGYDRVMAGVGQMGRRAPPVPSVCDVVYMPVREDYVSAARIEEFEGYLGTADDGSVRERVQKLKLPRMGSVIRREGYLKQLLFGELGDFIRQSLAK